MVKLKWNDKKRESNRQKHGLDFLDADFVLLSPYRFDLESTRNGEQRIQSFAYVFDVLMVLTVVYVPGEEWQHIISFRPAKRSEKDIYYDWLENDFDES